MNKYQKEAKAQSLYKLYHVHSNPKTFEKEWVESATKELLFRGVDLNSEASVQMALEIEREQMLKFMPNSNGKVAYPSIWRRLIAALLDFIIVVIILFLDLQYIFVNWLEYTVYIHLLSSVFLIIVHAKCLADFGATPGKYLLNLKVVRNSSTSELPSFGQAVKRHLVLILPSVFELLKAIYFAINQEASVFFPIAMQSVGDVFSVGWTVLLLLTILLSAKGRGWHDKLAGTVVVYRSNEEEMVHNKSL